MIEPWFDPIRYAWIPGTLIGLIGGTLGPFSGYCASKGKWKGLVMGLYYTVVGFCALLLVSGAVAWISGQPYGIWYGLGMAGVIGMLVFGSLVPVMHRVYRESELRQSQARDL
jgi:hypothetical protein